MKKVLALLFVCAGLTAMAVNPHVNMNAKVATGKPSKAMVLKATPMSDKLSAPAMNAGLKAPQEFFAERNVTPNDNQLLNKRAPRRVTEDDVLSTKLAFMVGYEYDSESGQLVLAPNRYVGGWDVDMELEENVLNAYMYFSGIPFRFNLDFENNTAEMIMETLGAWQWSDTTTSGRYTYINDTTEYLALWDEDFIFDESEDAAPANLMGTIYDDGTIYIPDGWTLYLVQYTEQRTIRNGAVQNHTYDTVAGLYIDFMHNTYLMTPNAQHDYDYYGTGTTANHYDNLAYMYQYDDTTMIAWNLWGFGARGIEFYLHEDGELEFPSSQIVGCDDVDDLEEAYPDYDWQTYGHWFINANGDGDDEASEIGTWDQHKLMWDGTTWLRFCLYGEDMYALSYYPMKNNILSFLSEDDMILFGTTADPIIVTETTDEAVIVSLELEEGAEYLMTVDGEFVEAPYSLERTNEEYTVTVMAVAQVPGKFMSEVVEMEVTVPALEPTWLRGDVDMDGSVGISDVTRLVDYILTHDATGMSLEAADTDQDGGIGIADVTKLVDYILTHSWGDEE